MMPSYRNHIPDAGFAEKLPSRDLGLLMSSLVVCRHSGGSCLPYLCFVLALLKSLSGGPWHFQPVPWWPRAGPWVKSLRCYFSSMYLAFGGLVSIKAMCVSTVTACRLPRCSRKHKLREAKCIARDHTAVGWESWRVDEALLLRRLASFHCLGNCPSTRLPAAPFSVEGTVGSHTGGSALSGLTGSKHAIA